MIVLQSYGGEIALRTYLFMLPAACLLAACFFFPDPRPGRRAWRARPILYGCALILPVAFFLARYGNEAFEQVPRGELAATDWVYAHDAHGVRLLWLSSAPAIDVTPQMPWSYRDIGKVVYIPSLGPARPGQSRRTGIRSAPRRARVVPDSRADPGGGAATDHQLCAGLGTAVQRVHVRDARRAGSLRHRQRRHLHAALATRRAAAAAFR